MGQVHSDESLTKRTAQHEVASSKTGSESRSTDDDNSSPSKASGEKIKRIRRSEFLQIQIDTPPQESDGPFSPLSTPPIATSEFNPNPNVDDESTTTKPSKQRKRSISNSSVFPNSNSQSGKPKGDEDSGGQLFFCYKCKAIYVSKAALDVHREQEGHYADE